MSAKKARLQLFRLWMNWSGSHESEVKIGNDVFSVESKLPESLTEDIIKAVSEKLLEYQDSLPPEMALAVKSLTATEQTAATDQAEAKE